MMHLSHPAKSANMHGPAVTLTAVIPETQMTFSAFSSQRVSQKLLVHPTI